MRNQDGACQVLLDGSDEHCVLKPYPEERHLTLGRTAIGGVDKRYKSQVVSRALPYRPQPLTLHTFPISGGIDHPDEKEYRYGRQE